MKHFLTVLSFAANQPPTFRAPCGYTSTNEKEFTRADHPTMKGVTCPACLEWGRGAATIATETLPVSESPNL